MIPEVQTFNEAAALVKAASKAGAELDIDAAIAARNGDEEAAAAAKEARRDHTTNAWYPAYLAEKEAAKALVAALGIEDAQALRHALG